MQVRPVWTPCGRTTSAGRTEDLTAQPLSSGVRGVLRGGHGDFLRGERGPWRGLGQEAWRWACAVTGSSALCSGRRAAQGRTPGNSWEGTCWVAGARQQGAARQASEEPDGARVLGPRVGGALRKG